jgi:DNA modification methylase
VWTGCRQTHGRISGDDRKKSTNHSIVRYTSASRRYRLTDRKNLKAQAALEPQRGGKLILEAARLNIETRSRISRLRWRGQFSPELIEYLMDEVCPDSQTFLDPFCGSGTVLYEAISRGCSAWGQEVNPAAWHLAALVGFASLPVDEKVSLVGFIRSLTAASSASDGDLFYGASPPETFLKLIDSSETHPMLKRALAAVLLLGMGDGRDLTPDAISRGGFSVLGVLGELMRNSGVDADCHLSDARRILLAPASVDAVITSPPYINVFNYHQNYRPAAELLGWKPLEAARSEIGANRKHRMNRFLTVIQYCLDMSQCLDEVARVLRTGAPLVIVLGRTSNVLGASFENGALIRQLLELSGAFDAVSAAERVFTNPFGARIYEDILIARRKRSGTTDLENARGVGLAALKIARESVPKKNLTTLDEAIAGAADVEPSPILSLSIPRAFHGNANSSHSISIAQR